MSGVDLAERLFPEPFVPFTIETHSGERFDIAERWQLLVSEKSVVVAKPSMATGVAEEFIVLSLAEIERIDDSRGGTSKRQRGRVERPTNLPALTLGHATPLRKEMVTLFTDGACQGNPGQGGWGFIIKDQGGNEVGRGSGGERPTTNNRMELTSVIRGLEGLDPAQSVKLITDSQYVSKGLADWMKGWKARGWKRKTNKGLEPVANEDLWRRLDELTATRKIVCEWVRGHAGHPENEECDRMAVDAAMNV